MNKRSRLRSVFCLCLLVFGLCVFAGCSAGQGKKYATEELDGLAEIRVYSAENNALIKTIYEEEQLYQYIQCSLWKDLDVEEERQNELKKEAEGAREQYYLVSYKYPAARFGSRELEETATITLYENTDIIKMAAAKESVKGFPVPEEFLIFYYEVSGEEMGFYRSLVE